MLTKREAAIISAYTGYLLGSFADMQKYADEKMGTQTTTIAFASEKFAAQLRDASREDFINIPVEGENATAHSG